MLKAIFAAILFCLSTQLSAQVTVIVKGTLASYDPSQRLYLENDGMLTTLQIQENGTFEVQQSTAQLPSFVSISTIASNGKILRQIPQVWFDSNRVELSVDLSDGSYTITSRLAFQDFADKLHTLSENERIKQALQNPQVLPSLHLVATKRESIHFNSLEEFQNAVPAELQQSDFFGRIAAYTDAKNRPAVKKGKKVENFILEDHTGSPTPLFSFNDKPKLIALFSSGCVYSIASIEFLEELYQTGSSRYEIITIWDDRSQDAFLNAYAEQKQRITWKNLLDKHNFTMAYMNTDIYPTFFIINEQGELTDVFKSYTKKSRKKILKLAE
ncbi:MAG: TlpA family protein disulfide reductase [Mongoliitalea sp.]